MEAINPTSEVSSVSTSPKAGFYRLVLFVFILVIVEFICAVPYAIFVSSTYPGTSWEELGEITMGGKNLKLMLLTQLAFTGASVLAVWFSRKFIDRSTLVSLGFSLKDKLRDLAIGGLWGIALIGIGFLVFWLGGFVEIQPGNLTGTAFWIYLLVYIMVAIGEEVVSRGYILNNLMEGMNKYKALLISSLLFGLFHIINSNVSIVGFLNITLSGALMGVYYIHRKNLWFPIAMHFTWNFFQGVVFGFGVSGTVHPGLLSHTRTGSDLLTGGLFGLEGSIVITPLLIISLFIADRLYRTEATGSMVQS